MKLSRDASYQLLAARYVRKQLKQLTGQLDGVRRAEDVEFVHRARVASRRLRAAMEMFDDCFGRKRLKRWQKELRRFTRDLGSARDRDVHAQFVCQILSRLQKTEHCAGLARLLVKLEHQREETQPKVLDAIDRLSASPVLDEMAQTTRSLVSKLGKRGVQVQSEFVFRQTEKHVLARMDEMLAYQDCLADPDDQDGHHAMRIAAKRLRYTMEICRPVHNRRLDDHINTVKEVQGLLGEIHDCDVWADDLERLLEEERRRIVKYYHHSGPLARLQAGIEYLRQERQQQRRQLFEKLVQYWEEVGRMGLWDDLVETVRLREAVSDQPEPIVAPPAGKKQRRPSAAWPKVGSDGDRGEPAPTSSRPASSAPTGRPHEEAH